MDENLLVIIPAYNEASRIAEVVRSIVPYAPVWVVDDGSVDDTGKVAESAGATVVYQSKNIGKGSALQRGFEYALEKKCSAVLTMDADGQHDPADIPSFLQEHAAHPHAVLLGNRMGHADSMPVVRRWTNRIMSRMLSKRIGFAVPDTQCGFRLYPASALQACATSANGFAAESEVLLHLDRASVPIRAVPIRTLYGDQQSKINPIADTFRFFNMLRRLDQAAHEPSDSIDR